ncbi:MAG: hypothetical protein RIB30_01300 [Thalassospira sp.]|uniref:hypothetical protein n=1 Tax=Thalassospira sp. TaxID=1912094 RepID=UPI0032EED1AA
MSPSKLVFSPEQVDVQDVESYKRFRSKAEEWSAWLSGDKTHAIIPHLHEMIWNHAVFKIINETRRMNYNKDFMSQNGLLAEFIDQSYVTFQATAVRRQLDRSSRTPEKQVISLRRLLDDIEQSRGLITRENYLAVEGLPYDWEPVRDQYYDSLRHSNGAVHWGDRTGPKAWDAARSRQILFDQLSGVVPENRCRTDVIKDEVFSELKQVMSSDVLEKLRECTNKLIAHAADEFSRSSSDEEPQYFAIDEVEKCHEIFIRVANALGNEILQIEHFGTFPTAQFNVFKFFDKPWVNKVGMTELSEFWNSYAEKVDKQARQNFFIDYKALYDC